MFHFGAFCTIKSIFLFQSLVFEILYPGLVNGVAINDVCFFKIPLKSPSIWFFCFVSFEEPPTVKN